MSKIKMTINNREVEAYEGQTVLEAAKITESISLLYVI